jgi:hypothetical protein
MRDLILKNLTSVEKKRRVLSSSETAESQGIRSIIRRRFICIVREIKGKQTQKYLPYLYILKARNTRELSETFFCKIKGNVYFIYEGKLFLILYAHSLKIDLIPVSRTREFIE